MEHLAVAGGVEGRDGAEHHRVDRVAQLLQTDDPGGTLLGGVAERFTRPAAHVSEHRDQRLRERGGTEHDGPLPRQEAVDSP